MKTIKYVAALAALTFAGLYASESMSADAPKGAKAVKTVVKDQKEPPCTSPSADCECFAVAGEWRCRRI